MTHKQVRDAVLRALARVRPEFAGREVTNATPPLSDLGIDSVAVIELSYHLETELGDETALEEWVAEMGLTQEAPLSVGALVQYLEARFGHAPEPAHAGSTANGRTPHS